VFDRARGGYTTSRELADHGRVSVDSVRIPAMDVQSHVHEAVHAVLSDDHNYERGVRAARDVVEAVLAASGPDGLVELAVATSLKLAEALEHVAAERGVAAVDVADVWLMI
jgi:hypothetical protein